MVLRLGPGIKYTLYKLHNIIYHRNSLLANRSRASVAPGRHSKMIITLETLWSDT